MAALWYDPTFCLFFYGGILVALAVLNRLTVPLSDSELLGAALILLWCGERAISQLLPQPPDPSWMIGLLDVSGFLITWYCRRKHDRPWKRFLAYSFLVAVALLTVQALISVMAPALATPFVDDTFTLARNLIFFSQVASVGWTGGRRVAVGLGRLLSRRHDHRHRLGAHP